MSISIINYQFCQIDFEEGLRDHVLTNMETSNIWSNFDDFSREVLAEDIGILLRWTGVVLHLPVNGVYGHECILDNDLSRACFRIRSRVDFKLSLRRFDPGCLIAHVENTDCVIIASLVKKMWVQIGEGTS